MWVLAALAPAVALAVDPWGWYPFGPVKFLAVAVLVAAGAAAVWRRPPADAGRAGRAATAAGLLLVGWMGIAALAGVDDLYAWVGTPERRFGVATWALCLVALAAGRRLGRADDRALAAGTALAAGGVGVVAIAEALGWSPGVLDVDGDRLTATFGSAAYLGAWGALAGPIVVGAAAEPRFPTWLRVLAAAGAGGTAVAVVGAGARAAWVGLAVAGVVIAVAHRHRLRQHPRVAVAGAAAIVIVGLAVGLTTPAGDRLTGTFDRDRPGGASRLDEWRLGWRVLSNDPLTGAGPEGYRIAVNRHIDADYERAHGREVQPDRAHAAPLDVAVAGGLPAVAAWLVVMAAVVVVAVRSLRRHGPWLVGVGAGLLAHIAGRLLLFPTAELEPLAWLLAGLLLAAVATDGGAAGVAWRHRLSSPAVLRVAQVGLAAVAVAAGALGIREVRADQLAAEAADARAEGRWPASRDAAVAAAAMRPDVVRLHLLAARARVSDEEGVLAGLAAVDDALRVSPGDPIARELRARFLVRRARSTQVPAHATQAADTLDTYLRHDPNRAAYWLLRTEAALLTGELRVAGLALDHAAHLVPDHPTIDALAAVIDQLTGDDGT